MSMLLPWQNIPRWQRFRVGPLAVSCLLLGQPYLADAIEGFPPAVSPDSPIGAFSMPRFNQEGFAAWRMDGQKGVFESRRQIRLEGLRISIFDGAETGLITLRLWADSARVDLEREFAHSEGRVEVEGDGFRGGGENWEWNGAEGRVTLNRNVRFDFESKFLQPSRDSP